MLARKRAASTARALAVWLLVVDGIRPRPYSYAASVRPSVQTFTDLYRYRFILSNLVGRNLKVMYRSMSLGMLWTLLNPLVMVTTLTLVWVVVFNNSLSFAAKVIVALIPYNFSVYCLTGCVHAIPGSASLVKKSAFPRQILPIAIITTHLIHFGIQALLMLAMLLVFPLEGGHFGLHLVWLLPIFVVHVALCTGVGLLVAGLNVMYRDVQYITESLLTVLFWLCPLVYTDADIVGAQLVKAHPWLHHVFYANPVSGLLTAYRDVLFHGTAPGLMPFGQAVVMTMLVGYVGMRTFWKYEREFADLV
jgi:lipopolysaccharide transport system permease protein